MQSLGDVFCRCRLTYKDDDCTGEKALGMVYELLTNDGVDAFFGLPCSAGRLCHIWFLLRIVWATCWWWSECNWLRLHHKIKYWINLEDPTFVPVELHQLQRKTQIYVVCRRSIITISIQQGLIDWWQQLVIRKSQFNSVSHTFKGFELQIQLNRVQKVTQQYSVWGIFYFLVWFSLLLIFFLYVAAIDAGKLICYLNLTWISYYSPDRVMANQVTYLTLMRAWSTFQRMSTSLLKLFNYYQVFYRASVIFDFLACSARVLWIYSKCLCMAEVPRNVGSSKYDPTVISVKRLL